MANLNGSPDGYGRRAASALVLLLAIAVGARWAFDLLRPLVPFLVSALVVLVIVMAVLRRRRW